MKKLSLIVICAFTALFFASCQSGKKTDKYGHTPSQVVDEMYKAIQIKDYAAAAEFTKIPDTILMDPNKTYPQFKNNPKKGDKIVITGKDWKDFVVKRMKEQSADFTLDRWVVKSEEISNTDPNSAKVKTTIYITTKDGKSEADCSFPLKRENNVWLIIG